MSHVAIFEVIFKSTSIHHFTLPFPHLLAPTVHTGFNMAMEIKAKESPLSFWTWWQRNLPCLIFPPILFDISWLYYFIYYCNSNWSFSFGSLQELLRTSAFEKIAKPHPTARLNWVYILCVKALCLRRKYILKCPHELSFPLTSQCRGKHMHECTEWPKNSIRGCAMWPLLMIWKQMLLVGRCPSGKSRSDKQTRT